MKRPTFNLRLAAWHEWVIYLVTAILVISGSAWLLLDQFGKRQGEFGPEPHAALPWLLLAHGSAAYVFVCAAAMLIPVHMRLGWYSRRNKPSGMYLVGTSLLLVGTGLALYYATSDGLRALASTSHWIIGLTLPIAMVIHLVRGKRSRASTTKRTPTNHSD